MTFKDLKQGDTLYVIDKANAEAKIGKINSIILSPGLQPGQIGIFKDVNIALGNTNKTYTVNQDWDTALADNQNTVITPNMDRALTEIKDIKKTCEDIVSHIDKYKENVKKCDKLLAELDPSFKEKQAYEQRFSKIEDAITQQTKDNTKIMAMLSKLLDK